jgi:uracil phosphoribosyltransferase
MSIRIVDHPLANHFLTQLRDRETTPAQFRALTHRLTALLAVEATRELETTEHIIQTPLEPFVGAQLISLVAVPILRAGLGMLDAFVDLLPDVAVGYIGLERDERTAIASSYYAKLPPEIGDRPVFILDPMLATGGSAAQAISLVKSAGARRVSMVCIVAAPDGVRMLSDIHPDVDIVSAALDRQLNDKKYILPGLGDFGDRLYGTVAL